MLMNTTCKIYISSSKINSCEDIANFLLKLNIIANVSENFSTIPCKYGLNKEKGCKIIYNCDVNTMKDKLWNPLKQKYGLDCAYIDIYSSYNGCIYDLYRKSSCPGINK